MKASIKDVIENLELHGHFPYEDFKKFLIKMSSATIDHMLKDERKEMNVKGRSHTKPNSLLKDKIRIKTFSEWDNPLKIKSINSDNGSEFINAHFAKYCQKMEIEFTRSRQYKKNDNCHVEKKNNAVVRDAVGYFRYDTKEELDLINELYTYIRRA